jgi:dTDP-4-dehydrorhamnose 3,5-epimerase
MLFSLVKKFNEKTIFNSKGPVLTVVKKNSKGFKGFGEAYFSWIYPKKIKGWKKHSKMTLNIVVPIGKIRFIFFNPLKKKFKSFIIGQSKYFRLNIPPNTWFAFQCLSKRKSLLLNIANIRHKKSEVENLPLKYIKFNWR